MAEEMGENEPEWNIKFREDEEMEFFTELALHEAERWIQAVTRRKFEYPDDFRKSLGNGILLCELLNGIKPGTIKRINKLAGAIAGLDNINVFLQACETKFGLTTSQLFDPSDLEDLSHRAIADENEELLKFEVDRRARNVAITIYWLGVSVSKSFKGPALDSSAFSALVHCHGGKNIISDDYHSPEHRNSLNNQSTPNNRHIRDSSYDSLGSYDHESESSFDDLDGSGSMPVRSDMRGEMRRAGSERSLVGSGLRLSTNESVFDDRHDSMYQSSPDLSQGSHAHTRSSSTDSMDGSYYGNHSRQSSGSADNYPTRRVSSSGRKTSSSKMDPLQFVKPKSAEELARQAAKQIEITKEVNKMRGMVDTGSMSEEPDWQSNFNNWKSKRRKSAYEKLGDIPDGNVDEEEEKEEKKVKTFGQMMAERTKRKSVGTFNIYPLDDDGDFARSPVVKTEKQLTESTPPSKPRKSKAAEVAPWARDSSGEADSQSDSETNNSHQSGDTDSVFSDKSNPSKVLSDDDSGMKGRNNNSGPAPNRPLRDRPMSNNVKLWEANVLESQKDGKKKWESPKSSNNNNNNSNNSAKIKNITQAFEQKEKEANEQPVIRRRSEYRNQMTVDYGSSSNNRFSSPPAWKSLDLDATSPSHKSLPKSPLSPSSPLSPTAPKALQPRDQRYSHSTPTQVKDTSDKDKPAKSQSPMSRYFESLSPKSPKPPLTSLDLAKESRLHILGSRFEPPQDRFASARAKFESLVTKEKIKEDCVVEKESNALNDDSIAPELNEKQEEEDIPVVDTQKEETLASPTYVNNKDIPVVDTQEEVTVASASDVNNKDIPAVDTQEEETVASQNGIDNKDIPANDTQEEETIASSNDVNNKDIPAVDTQEEETVASQNGIDNKDIPANDTQEEETIASSNDVNNKDIPAVDTQEEETVASQNGIDNKDIPANDTQEEETIASSNDVNNTDIPTVDTQEEETVASSNDVNNKDIPAVDTKEEETVASSNDFDIKDIPAVNDVLAVDTQEIETLESPTDVNNKDIPAVKDSFVKTDSVSEEDMLDESYEARILDAFDDILPEHKQSLAVAETSCQDIEDTIEQANAGKKSALDELFAKFMADTDYSGTDEESRITVGEHDKVSEETSELRNMTEMKEDNNTNSESGLCVSNLQRESVSCLEVPECEVSACPDTNEELTEANQEILTTNTETLKPIRPDLIADLEDSVEIEDIVEDNLDKVCQQKVAFDKFIENVLDKFYQNTEKTRDEADETRYIPDNVSKQTVDLESLAEDIAGSTPEDVDQQNAEAERSIRDEIDDTNPQKTAATATTDVMMSTVQQDSGTRTVTILQHDKIGQPAAIHDDLDDVFYPPEDVHDGLETTQKPYSELTIRINQKPNNNKGFGFTLVGGSEKKSPVTVTKVSLGDSSDNDDEDRSAADVCDVLVNDEIQNINGRDVTTLTLAQVQGIIDHSLKRGEITLKVKRFAEDTHYDSMEEDEGYAGQSTLNKMETQSDSSSLSTEPISDDTPTSYKPAIQSSTRTDDSGQPRIMDQLLRERERETNNNEQKLSYKENAKPPSPVMIEQLAPKSVRQVRSEPPSYHGNKEDADMNRPDEEVVVEERQTVSRSRPSVESSPVTDQSIQPVVIEPVQFKPPTDQSPVVMRRSREPVVQESPPPPAPPKDDPPPLANISESSAGFQPPSALLRWQRPRPKSEYHSPYSTTTLDEQVKVNKRLSSTLPWGSGLKDFDMDKEYSKDDTMLDKVSQDFDTNVNLSRTPGSSKFKFDDEDRQSEWQHKQEEQQKPEMSMPAVDLPILREHTLTAQNEAPTRKRGQIDAPNLADLNNPPLSPQEKFERDQQRIRQQYEEEKRRARDVEKKKQEQEKQVLNSDKFLRDMESQVVQTKQEAVNKNLGESQPITANYSQPRFNSEPMTIKLPSNTPGRPLVIDPRNQGELEVDTQAPEYSFHVNLSASQNQSNPPLRQLGQPELLKEELLAQEREKIREEEKKKFEEERLRWKEEQEQMLRQEQENLRLEQERLQKEREHVEQERAMLEQKRYVEASQNNNFLYTTPRSSAGSSPLSPKSAPPALDPKHRDARRAPPPTAPKPDKSTKARLTREDLLAMNRKATPMTQRPEMPDDRHSDSEYHNNLREPPSKTELHSLNAVPKQKFRNSGAWMKDEDEPSERPFVIGKRSDLIHKKDYSNPNDHWLVREAEKRRLADHSDYSSGRRDNVDSITAHAGPVKPSQSSLINRFRGDVEPTPRSNRYSYPSHSSDSRLSGSARPLSASGSSLGQLHADPEIRPSHQFSANTQPSTYSNPELSQTLPPNLSFSANMPPPRSSLKQPRSMSDDTEPVIAVSGKQKCSHCSEELAGLKFSKV